MCEAPILLDTVEKILLLPALTYLMTLSPQKHLVPTWTATLMPLPAVSSSTRVYVLVGQ